MVRWPETEYVKRAQDLAQQHVVSRKSINDLAEKVATDNALTPDEIRTLVRLANVAVFQELFKRKDDGDKMVEFETGDPEAVIRRLLESQNTPPQSATIDNDKLAGEVPDQMRVKRYGAAPAAPSEPSGAPEVTKVASARKDYSVLALRKMSDEFDIAKTAAAQDWESRLQTLSRVFRRAEGYGPGFEDFEKDAYAVFGGDAEPELVYLRELTRRPLAALPATKIAELQERYAADDSAELTAFKLAKDARESFERYERGARWVSEQLKRAE